MCRDVDKPDQGTRMIAGTETVSTTHAVAHSSRGFDDALYAALSAMAVKSPRFQADVQAAMRRAGLPDAGPTHLAAALQRLEGAGRVSNLIHLRDGGTLVTVAV